MVTIAGCRVYGPNKVLTLAGMPQLTPKLTLDITAGWTQKPDRKVTSINQQPWHKWPGAAVSGAYSHGIDSTFFGDVIVWPRTLDLGLVLSAKQVTIGVWNLTGWAQHMSKWQINGLDGVTVTNADGYPVWFPYNGYRDYQVTVNTAGQAVIAGSINFIFDNLAVGSSTTLSGSRLIVFGYNPNWRDPVKEKLEWLTDVMTMHNGKEQRLALRQQPRRSMQYLFTLENAGKIDSFQGLMFGWQQRVFCVPVWTDWQFLGSAVAAGGQVVTISTNLMDFAPSNMVLLWRDYLTWEVCEINTMTATQITFKKPTIGAWTTNDRIIPLRLGRVPKTFQLQRPTSTIAEVTLTFSFEVPTQVNYNRLGTSSFTQFNSLDVLLTPPNTTTDLTEDYNRDIETVDYDKGAWYSQCNDLAPVVVRPYRWLLKTRQEIMNLFAFLDSKRGKHVPFYMPTWSKDVELAQVTNATDTSLLIKNIGYTRYIKTQASRTSIIIFFCDPTITPIILTITGSAESANNNEVLSLSSQIGRAIQFNDVKAICWLNKCRFDQDEFEVTWHTDRIAEVQANIREIIQ
jgi:hypothetical protein